MSLLKFGSSRKVRLAQFRVCVFCPNASLFRTNVSNGLPQLWPCRRTVFEWPGTIWSMTSNRAGVPASMPLTDDLADEVAGRNAGEKERIA
jgi:hypothetical protein